MATIYSGNNDGYVRAFSTVNWATTKALTTGNSASATGNYYNFAIQSGRVSLRGGTVLFVNTRSCFEFDTSGISETPTSATLNIYAAEVTSWSISGYNSITLNSTALNQIRSASTFKIMCMESVHDMRDIEPSANNRSGAYYANNTGTSKDPYLDITEAVTTNATFFGCNF